MPILLKTTILLDITKDLHSVSQCLIHFVFLKQFAQQFCISLISRFYTCLAMMGHVAFFVGLSCSISAESWSLYLSRLFSLCKATEHFPGPPCHFTGPSSWVPLTQVLFIGLDFSVVEGGVAVLGLQLGLSYVAGMLRKLQDWHPNCMLTEGKKTSELCWIYNLEIKS